MKCIKIAHCMVSLSGGVGSVIFNYFDQFNHDDYEVHIITQDLVSKDYEKLYTGRGYKIHVVPSKKEGIIKNISALKKIMDEEHFDIVHCHMSITNLFPLFAAKASGVKVRINHSHLSLDLNFIERCTVRISKLFSTDLFACGQDAGTKLFGNSKFILLRNAIKLDQYMYGLEERDRQRAYMKIGTNTTLYCHVGRFTQQKNHSFLLDIFEKIWNIDSDSKLMLIGDGELFDEIKDKAANYICKDNILFLGMISDVNMKLQAADVFILPSRKEGLCVAAIEAQAAGIPCVLSSNVDQTTAVNDNVVFVTSNDAEVWAQKCLECSKMERIKDTTNLKKSGFDIITESKKLDMFYKKAVQR